MRLTTDKPTKEMGMYELAHNSCYIDKDGNTRYRDFNTDVDARMLARELLKKYADGDDAFTDDDNFDDEIMELLQYGTRTIEGLIALFYRNLWAMSELRETLKQYEDLGTVEELRLCFNPPEVLYIIGDETDGEKVHPVYPVDGEQVEFANGNVYWNCRDDFDDYVELPLEGLNEKYFLSSEEAHTHLN